MTALAVAPVVVRFRVDGVPIPQGSMRLGRNKATGSAVMFADNHRDLRPWRKAVTVVARQAVGPSHVPLDCAVELCLTFWMPRPQRPASEYPIGRPDADKLLRAVCDSLTDARVWVDDSRVVDAHVAKRWAVARGREGVFVEVTPALGPRFNKEER